MKNINTKKIVAGVAALGLSALLAGSVVAANVGGDDFSLDITKDSMFNASGVPAVSVIVGSMAQPIDVVWAGNIAAAIGKKAYTSIGDSVTGGALQDVTVDVGMPSSSASVAVGSGDVDDIIDIDIDTGDAFNIDLDYFSYNKLFDGDIKGKLVGETSYENSIVETLTLNGEAMFSTDRKVQDLIALINTGEIEYRATFTDPLAYSVASATNTNGVYFGTGSSLEMYFMGEKYDVQSVSQNKITLVGSGGRQAYTTGSTISVMGSNDESYSVEIGNAYQSSGDLVIQLKLLQNGTVLSTQLFAENDTVEFPGYTLADSISVVQVYDDTSTVNVDIAELSVGTGSLLELENNKVLPGYKSGTKDLWTVTFDYDANNAINYVQVANKDARWHREDFSVNDAGLAVGDKIQLPLGLGYIEFLGLTTETPVSEVHFGDNKVTWHDEKGRLVSVPMYEENLDKSTIDVGGRDYYFEVDGGNLTVYKGTTDTSEYIAAFALPNYETLETSSGVDVNYYFTETKGLSMALAGTTQYDIGKSSGATWEFLGTFESVDGNLTQPHFDGNATSGSDWHTVFLVIEDTGDETYVFVDPYTQDIARRGDYGSSTKYYGDFRKVVHEFTLDTDDFTNGNWYLDDVETDDMDWAYTRFGSKVSFDSSKAMFEVPNSILYLQMFMGGEMTVLSEDNSESFVFTETGQTETKSGITAKLVSANVTGGASGDVIIPANWNANTQRIVYLDNESMLPTGPKVIVGGHLVNVLAEGVTNEYLTETGQYVVGAMANGNVIVAGWNAADTANAAKDLINVIETM